MAYFTIFAKLIAPFSPSLNDVITAQSTPSFLHISLITLSSSLVSVSNLLIGNDYWFIKFLSFGYVY